MSINHRKQIPGQPWIFKSRVTGETDFGVLPASLGEHNEFATWIGNHWVSRKFGRLSMKRTRRAQGPDGLLGRMKYLSAFHANTAKKGNYKPPTTTPEQMLSEWLAQDGKCAACKEPLTLFDPTGKTPQSCYDHNHETGEPRGFIHQQCNKVEGLLVPMTDEAFENLIKWLQAIRVKKAQ